MTEKTRHKTLSSDQGEILALIERWAEAVRKQDRAAIRRDHDVDMLMFDVPPPFQARGLDAYMASWETFYQYAEKPVAFEFDDIEITAGADVAFATATGNCVNITSKGVREPLQFRLTMGLRKIGGRWQVTHEHHSLPAEE
jgi:ketosteroid isomerase-like protein